MMHACARFLLVCFCVCMLSWSACAPSSEDGELSGNDDAGTGSGNGTLVLNLSDAPIDAANVAGVFITIIAVQYHVNDTWVALAEFDGPQTYNLLELRAGNFALLGTFTLPAGSYSQLRFLLDIPVQQGESPTNPGSYVAFTDGRSVPLFVPSGAQTGYKASGAFTVPVDGVVEVTADFDARQAVLQTDNSSRFLLKPTIRLVVNEQAGSITGTITNASDFPNMIVYAYPDGTWTEAEDDTPADDAIPRFPHAIASARMSPTGSYTLTLLAAGTYDLAVAGFVGETFGHLLGFVADVEVHSGPATPLDIDTAALSTAHRN